MFKHATSLEASEAPEDYSELRSALPSLAILADTWVPDGYSVVSLRVSHGKDGSWLCTLSLLAAGQSERQLDSSGKPIDNYVCFAGGSTLLGALGKMEEQLSAETAKLYVDKYAQQKTTPIRRAKTK